MAILLLLQNELAILEFIHCLVETLDRYFSNVCELDLMFNLEMVSARLTAARVATICVCCFGWRLLPWLDIGLFYRHTSLWTRCS